MRPHHFLLLVLCAYLSLALPTPSTEDFTSASPAAIAASPPLRPRQHNTNNAALRTVGQSDADFAHTLTRELLTNTPVLILSSQNGDRSFTILVAARRIIRIPLINAMLEGRDAGEAGLGLELTAEMSSMLEREFPGEAEGGEPQGAFHRFREHAEEAAVIWGRQWMIRTTDPGVMMAYRWMVQWYFVRVGARVHTQSLGDANILANVRLMIGLFNGRFQ